MSQVQSVGLKSKCRLSLYYNDTKLKRERRRLWGSHRIMYSVLMSKQVESSHMHSRASPPTEGLCKFRLECRVSLVMSSFVCNVKFCLQCQVSLAMSSFACNLKFRLQCQVSLAMSSFTCNVKFHLRSVSCIRNIRLDSFQNNCSNSLGH